jgi:hypothetical protein
MKYYKAIEESNYDNNNNCHTQTRFEIVGYKPKTIYICGYDFNSKNSRNLEVTLSEDFNNYSTILNYEENDAKKIIKFSYDYGENKEIYDIVEKMFSIKYPHISIETNMNEKNVCSTM